MSKELSNIEQPFEVEVHGEVTLLRFHLEDGLLAIDFEQIGQLWHFLDQQKKRPSKVLLCLGPSGFLAPDLVDQVWNKRVANEMDVMRFLNGIHRFVIEIQEIDSFVIGALSGEIDFSFVGAVLACDYRISAHDTVFLNRFLDSGLPSCGGVPWFLTRFFGHEKTARILLTKMEIPAGEAYGLGLVDEVIHLVNLQKKALETAQRFSAIPAARLSATKRLMAAAAHTKLADYRTYEENPFTRFLASCGQEDPLSAHMPMFWSRTA